jgi:hypothetical protein
VYGALRGWTQQETVEWWADQHESARRTRQSVSDALDRAHWTAVDEALKFVEDRLTTAVEAPHETRS